MDESEQYVPSAEGPEPTQLSPLAPKVGSCTRRGNNYTSNPSGNTVYTPVDGLLNTEGWSWIALSTSGVRATAPDDADQVKLELLEAPLAYRDTGAAPADVGSEIVGVPSRVRDVLEEPGQLLVRVRWNETGWLNSALVFIDDEGRIAAPVECGIESARTLATYVEQNGRRGDLLIAIATDPNSAEHLLAQAEQDRRRAELSTTTTTGTAQDNWRRRPATSRQIVLGETPDDVIAQLLPVTVRLEIPASWRGDRRTLCTRTSVAWGECARMSAVVEPDMQTWFPWLIWVAPGEEVEMWLLDEEASLDHPIAKLGYLDSNALQSLAPATLGGRVIVVSFTPEAVSGRVDDIASRVQPVLSVRIDYP